MSESEFKHAVWSAVVAVLSVCAAGYACNRVNKGSYNKCIELTQKPLECRARLDQ